MARKNFGLDPYTADQNSNPVDMSPWIPRGVPGVDQRGSKWYVHKLDLCHNKLDLRQAVSHSFSLLYLQNILLLFS